MTLVLLPRCIRKIKFWPFFSIFRLDDIEDNSCLRRGVPVAHSIYGVASTINAANYICFLAMEKVQQLDHPDVSRILYCLFSIALKDLSVNKSFICLRWTRPPKYTLSNY